MAKFNVVGLDDVQEAMLRQDAIVEEAVPEMLKAGGAVMQKAQQEEIKTRFNSRRSTGALLASIKVSAVKEIDGGKRVEIYPNGKDKHGVRNAEKGFVLNYGRSNMPARGSRRRMKRRRTTLFRKCAAYGRKSKMKNVDSLLKAELEKLGVPVERLKYGGKAACFIVYQLVVGRATFFSDDEEGAQEFTYQVHVYSKTDYIDILQRLKTALKAAGFYAITIDAETYEQDTGYYHVPVEIKYMEV